MAICASDRNAALTAAALGNKSVSSGAITTTLELVRSFSRYFRRTKGPKSERLYSERSSSAATVLSFLTGFPFCPRRRTSADGLDDRRENDLRIIARYRKRIGEHNPRPHRTRLYASAGSPQLFDHSIRSAPITLASLQYRVEPMGRSDGSPNESQVERI